MSSEGHEGAERAVVCIPTYNEAENIGPLTQAIRATLPDLDILVVDDNSPDGTGAIAENLEGVSVIHRPGKLGLGTAYIQAFKHALAQGYAYIAQMDADFSHDPAVLAEMLHHLRNGAHVCAGSRYTPGGGTVDWGFHRRFLSRNANRTARRICGLKAKDVTSGFRAYRREVLEAIGLDSIRSEGYVFLVEVLTRVERCGYPVVEVPIVFKNRVHGVSKMNTDEILNGIWQLMSFGLRRGNRE